MMLERKTLALESLTVKGHGFVGLASERSLDLVGDVIAPGAYDAWLRKFEAGHVRVTLNDSHKTDSIFAVLGGLARARVLPHGLETSFEFIPDDPAADAAHKRVALGYVNGLSIGFMIERRRQPTGEERQKGILRVLEEVDIKEVSLVQNPAQPAACILAVSSVGKQSPRAPETGRRFDFAPGWDLPPAGERRMSAVDTAVLRKTLAELRANGPASEAMRRECRATYRRLQHQTLRGNIDRLLLNYRPVA
jgi:HK97 family phage prohead protease